MDIFGNFYILCIFGLLKFRVRLFVFGQSVSVQFGSPINYFLFSEIPIVESRVSMLLVMGILIFSFYAQNLHLMCM